MQRQTSKWRADRSVRATRDMQRIETSIARLNDEDLLDLHDIFVGDPGSPLEVIASIEIQRRALTP